MKKPFFKFATLITALLTSIGFSEFSNATINAPVLGFARAFATAKPLAHAKITILENGAQIETDDSGRFGPIQWPVGSPITFVIEQAGYRTTQSATVIVPPQGLTSPYNIVSVQPVDLFTFYMLAATMGVTLDEEKCHAVTTITAYHKTLDDLPQGEDQAKILITPATSEKPYYYDIFKSGPLKDYTNPITRGLTETTKDGGVVFANLEPQATPYTLTAFKPGVLFSQTQFICRKGVFINMSPPQGPTVLL